MAEREGQGRAGAAAGGAGCVGEGTGAHMQLGSCAVL